MRIKSCYYRTLFLSMGFLGVATMPRGVFAETWHFDSTGELGALGWSTMGFDSIVFNTVAYALSFFGLLSVVMIMVGGIMYLTAGGNTERVDTAKAVIRNALIGMAVIILSYSATFFFYSTVTLLSTPQPPS